MDETSFIQVAESCYTDRSMFRRDIQGLRAIAVVAVLLYHFWPHRLTGGYVGVDVFFVISGFLITLHLLKKPPTSKKQLIDFWARRIKRLIPAATTVLFATVVASLLWLPETMIQGVLKEAVVSAIYGQNWLLAINATDYLASTDAPSPLQHYWSLSIEEQYYVLWPIIIGGIFLLGKRYFSARKLLIASMAVIFVSSLCYSIYLTAANPAAAYFVTLTRVWELALGGIVALLTMRYTLPAKLAVPAAWIGLAMIGVAVLFFNKETPFPGYTALLPTLGAALVILAATDNMKWSPYHLLKLKIVQFLGDISYSIYLWHWPVLIIAPFAFGVTKMPLALSASLIVNIILLSYLTKIYIEDPVRFSKRLVGTNYKTYAYGVASILVVVGLTFAAAWHPKVQAQQQVDDFKLMLNSDPCVGAGVLREKRCLGKFKDELLASPGFFKNDKSVLYEDSCWSRAPDFLTGITCEYGNRSGNKKIALLGNSHAGMWHAAIEQIARKNGWRLDTYLASQCYTVDRPIIFKGAAEKATEKCQEWNRWAIQEIIAKEYDVVVMSNLSTDHLKDVKENDMFSEQVSGYTDTIDKFTSSNVRTFILRDAPRGKNGKSVPDCLAASDVGAEGCTSDRKVSLLQDPLYEAAKRRESRDVGTLNLTDRFCDETKCHPVMGGVIMYFDHSHLSNSYVLTLTPDIETPLVTFMSKP